MNKRESASIAVQEAAIDSADAQDATYLPDATIEQLEQYDIGAAQEDEKPAFRITDDRCADWALRKIAEERSEYDRIKALADEQIETINARVEAAKRRCENSTSFLTSCLAAYFETVPHKVTKTTEKYRLLSGTLVKKRGGIKTKVDDAVLVPWLKENGLCDLVKIEETAKWGELKRMIDFSDDMPVMTDTGLIVEGVTVYEAPDTFTVDI